MNKLADKITGDNPYDLPQKKSLREPCEWGASVDTRYGFVLNTEITPASHHDSHYLPLCVAGSCHTKEPIKKVFADKGYFGKPNREFLNLNKIEDGIMRKATKGTGLTAYETACNKAISKVRRIVEQYFGLSHLYNKAFGQGFKD